MSQPTKKAENRDFQAPFKHGPAIIHQVITFIPMELPTTQTFNQEQSHVVAGPHQPKPFYVTLTPIEPPIKLPLDSGERIFAAPQRRYSISSVKSSASVASKRNCVVLTPVTSKTTLAEKKKVPGNSSDNPLVSVSSIACKSFKYGFVLNNNIIQLFTASLSRPETSLKVETQSETQSIQEIKMESSNSFTGSAKDLADLKALQDALILAKSMNITVSKIGPFSRNTTQRSSKIPKLDSTPIYGRMPLINNNLEWKSLQYLPYQPMELDQDDPVNDRRCSVDENVLDGWKIRHVAEVLDDLVSSFSEFFYKIFKFL